MLHHCHFGKPPARPEDSLSPTVLGMVHLLPVIPVTLPLTLTLSLREREQPSMLAERSTRDSLSPRCDRSERSNLAGEYGG